MSTLDDMQAMVKTIIETQVIKALNEAPEAIEKLVKAALAQPVDQNGDAKGYGTKMPYLDWLVGEEIRAGARVATRKVITEHAATIESAVRGSLAQDDVAKAITRAVVGAADREWSIRVSFANEKH